MSSLEDFFNQFVRGIQELDYNAALGAAGLKLETNATAGSGANVSFSGRMLRRTKAG